MCVAIVLAVNYNTSDNIDFCVICKVQFVLQVTSTWYSITVLGLKHFFFINFLNGQCTPDTETQLQQPERALKMCKYKHRGWAGTCVNTEQPGADQRGERLAGFGQQGNHPEEESGDGLMASVYHKIFVDQIRNHQFQQLAGALCEHPVTRRKRWQVRVSSQL